MAEKKEVTKQQKIALAVMGVVGVFMIYKYFYVPMGGKIEEVRKRLEENQGKLEKTRMRANQLAKLQQEFDEMREDLAEAEKRLPKDINLPEVIRTCTKMMEKHGIEFQNFTPAGKNAKQYFTEVPFSINATSSLHGICRFIAEIGQLERIYVVRDLRVVPRGDSLTYNNASVSFQIVTYAYK